MEAPLRAIADPQRRAILRLVWDAELRAYLDGFWGVGSAAVRRQPEHHRLG